MANGSCHHILKTVSILLAAIFIASAASLNLLAGSVTGGEADVKIGLNPEYGAYRYSLDIVFYSMRFSYNLRSIAHNSETDETYVNSGEWVMDENKMNSVTVTVVNHSDTPIKVTAQVNTADFRFCGVVVNRQGLTGDVLPAVKLVPEGDAEVSSREMILTLVGIPSLTAYKGQKVIYATVCVVPESGYASNGQYYESKY